MNPRNTPAAVHTPENWSLVSADYEANLAPFTGQYAADLLDAASFHEGAHILEVAAGSGALTVQLASRVAAVTATDYAPGMLDRLRHHLKDEGITNVRVMQMDGQALDFEDNSFDGAVCNFALMLFDDRASGFAELCRVIRPGACAVVSAWSYPEHFEPRHVMMKALQHAVPDLELPAQPPPVFSLADPDVFKQEMLAGGFREVDIRSVTHDLEAPTPEAYWDRLAGSAPPSLALYHKIGEAGARRLKQQVIDDLTERFGDAPVRLSAEARIGIGWK